MREPANDIIRIQHMIEAIDNALTYTKGKKKEELMNDKILLHATIYNIQIIGEAVNKLTPSLKTKYSFVPWAQIEKMRHILVHDYYRVNFDFIWLVLQEDLAELRQQLLAIQKDFCRTND